MSLIPIKVFSRVIGQSIYANSSYLLSGWILLSGFGLIFWTICTHLYSDVRLALPRPCWQRNLISSLSLMGFELSIIRILPVRQDKSTLLNICLSTASLFGIIFSLMFMLLLPFFSGALALSVRTWLPEFFFVLFVIIAVDYLLNNVFIAYRKSVVCCEKSDLQCL